MTLLHLFRRDPSTQNEHSPISYDDRLIEMLRQDHRRQIRQLQELQRLTHRHQYKDIHAKLGHFRSLLQTHLMTENVRLYGYLTYRLDVYGDDARRAGDFRREMYSLGHTVMSFVKQYQETGVSKANIGIFAKELAEVGATLVRRIRREENDLFPLYEPPQSGSERRRDRITGHHLSVVPAR